ncbi:MAG: hypothetical protein ACHQQ3_08055 [Gemmatimonadales bacterium]
MQGAAVEDRTMSRWFWRTCALIAPCLIGCSSAEPTGPGTAQLPPGCFRLTLGSWSGSHEALDPPTFLILMDSVGADGLERGQRLVRAVPIVTRADYQWMWWSTIPADSLRLVFTGGFVGVDVHLARRDSTWQGVANAFTDVAPSTQATAAATLAPMFCPP